MVCPACTAELAESAKFCPECGTPVQAPSCASCGTAHAPGQKFCAECGTALAGAAAKTPPAAAPGTVQSAPELRLVSVLFVDLVGYTSLSEGRDAEEVRELLGRYFESTRTIIERYAGTVEKFIGDAVMAVWGTPIAREDDAERAVRAGLEILDARDGLRGRTSGCRTCVRAPGWSPARWRRWPIPAKGSSSATASTPPPVPSRRPSRGPWPWTT